MDVHFFVTTFLCCSHVFVWTRTNDRLIFIKSKLISKYFVKIEILLRSLFLFFFFFYFLFILCRLKVIFIFLRIIKYSYTIYIWCLQYFCLKKFQNHFSTTNVVNLSATCRILSNYEKWTYIYGGISDRYNYKK